MVCSWEGFPPEHSMLHKGPFLRPADASPVARGDGAGGPACTAADGSFQERAQERKGPPWGELFASQGSLPHFLSCLGVFQESWLASTWEET